MDLSIILERGFNPWGGESLSNQVMDMLVFVVRSSIAFWSTCIVSNGVYNNFLTSLITWEMINLPTRQFTALSNVSKTLVSFVYIVPWKCFHTVSGFSEWCFTKRSAKVIKSLQVDGVSCWEYYTAKVIRGTVLLVWLCNVWVVSTQFHYASTKVKWFDILSS